MRKSQLKKIIDNHEREYWQDLILKWVHDEKAREILTRVLLDNASLESMVAEDNVDYKTYYKKYKQGIDKILEHTQI